MKMTARLKKNFLSLLEEGETAINTAKSLGLSVRTFERHREKDEAFAELWAESALIGAKVQLCDMEAEADRRGVEGVEEPVFYKGGECGRIKKYSDRLLILRMKAMAKRAGDDSYVERSDVTSKGEQVQAGIIVLGKPETDEDAWHAKHSGT